MKKQVIKFSGTFGNVKAETLRGGLLDLRKMGETEMHRSSEIEFDSERQLFYIRLLEPMLDFLNDSLRDMMFPTYEDAVDFEVRLLHTARKHTAF